MNEQTLHHGALRQGSVCGALAVLAYVGWSTLPMPDAANRLLHFGFGPLLVCAFLGIWHYLGAGRPRFVHLVACAFGIAAGVAFTAMTVVQASMVDSVLLPLRAADDPAVKAHLRYVLQGTNSVQLGLDVVWDLFITLATVLVGTSLWRFGGALRVYGIVGVLAGGVTLAINLWSFPTPPAQGGLFDLGPFVGGWFGGICILMARSGFGRVRG